MRLSAWLNESGLKICKAEKGCVRVTSVINWVWEEKLSGEEALKPATDVTMSPPRPPGENPKTDSTRNASKVESQKKQKKDRL